MSTHKQIDRICIAVMIAALLFGGGLMVAYAGTDSEGQSMGYESRLFDTSEVHTVDIVMDDWEGFVAECENEEYALCSVVVDGEAYKNVAIRAKGNTSLSSVAQMNSQRYSFKIEFDHYDSGKSYHGLDKLSLNNLIQDNSYMKDYLAYRMMAAFGVDTPLCSFVYITVNGEDWGLYLAVEGVEDSFLQRNYGSDYGELYKPDSLSFGAGAGNGKDFDMDDFLDEDGNFAFPSLPTADTEFGTSAEMFSFSFPTASGEASGESFASPEMSGEMDFSSMGFGGQADVKLQYIDDDPDSYSNIFNNAKTDVSSADEQRLIQSLKTLSSYENLEEVLDTEEVLRYMVVHNFVVNGDSYTGSMIHNYYLYEEDGQLSMIPWDYNLAYGTFSGNASSAVNDPIDDVLDDRPMQAWIFSDESYTEAYHTLYAAFLDSVDIQGILDEAYALIAPYVETDPTKFCTYEEFESGVTALKEFCYLRSESVSGQLDGSIPSTSEGQSADSSALIATGELDLSDMGTMGSSMGGGFGGMGGASLDWSSGEWPASGEISAASEEPQI